VKCALPRTGIEQTDETWRHLQQRKIVAGSTIRVEPVSKMNSIVVLMRNIDLSGLRQTTAQYRRLERQDN